MKFRCERDTLAEAVAHRPAGGRVPHRRASRCCRASGSRSTPAIARAGRHRPRAHDPGAGPGRQRRRGQRGRPGAAVLGDRAPARGRHRDGRAGRRRRPDRGRPLRHHAAHAVGRRVPAAARGRRGRRAGRRRGRSPRRCARWCRRASRDDARPILTGVLLTASAGGLRLVATDSYRLAVRDLAGRQHARPRARRSSSAAKGLNEVQRLLSGATARSRSCSASARSCSASAPPRSPPG